eukprot:gnl/MRDRNA2_/MRDRNA2_73826_c0_seq1.p1 gnl/MRDRNA2_/MRDRNA2_73826_c0~~gnl/MRDRNA2_/MRDRNA2_73826_c0_seq1.p1  ORF type:complete len:641 (+),score=121.08 gnl/MRDRNA2_/MRDRNA2_73826_c0_seq1:88-2010(+)
MKCWRGVCRYCKKIGQQAELSEPLCNQLKARETSTSQTIAAIDQHLDHDEKPKILQTKSKKKAKVFRDIKAQNPTEREMQACLPEISGGTSSSETVPKFGQPLLIQLEIRGFLDKDAPDGSTEVVLHTEEVEYMPNTRQYTSVAPALLDKALSAGMCIASKAKFRCPVRCIASKARRDAADTKDLCVIMTVIQVYDDKDVLPEFCREMCQKHEDWRLIKRTINNCASNQTEKARPTNGAKVVYRLISVRESGGAVLFEQGSDPLEVTLGEGQVCEAFEFGFLSMHAGEHSRFFTSWHMVSSTNSFTGLKTPEVKFVECEVQLLSFETAADPYAMTRDDVIKWAKWQKECCATMVKKKRYVLAALQYRLIRNVLKTAGFGSDKQDALEIVQACCLNFALCCIKLEAFAQAVEMCDEVLAQDAQNTKALYRKTQACMAMRDYGEAAVACKAGLKTDPNDEALKNSMRLIGQRACRRPWKQASTTLFWRCRDGLTIETLQVGDCTTFPQDGDTLHMHYTGTLQSNGEQFDSSRGKNVFKFELGKGKVIEGWDVGIVNMSLGERAILHVPWWMGYGLEGDREIPPQADLDFDVELVGIQRGADLMKSPGYEEPELDKLPSVQEAVQKWRVDQGFASPGKAQSAK